MGIIYLLTSPDGKRYVGQTTLTLKKRLIRHKSCAKTNPNYGCVYLNHAINKHGFDKFKIEILLECPDDMLDLYERKHIELLDSVVPNGYNIMIGGHDNRNLSSVVKQKISETRMSIDTQKYRKTTETRELPKYLTLIKKDGCISGYKISKHPLCNLKVFIDKGKTIIQNKNDAYEFLMRLNNRQLMILPKVGYKICYIYKNGKINQMTLIATNSKKMSELLDTVLNTLYRMDTINYRIPDTIYKLLHLYHPFDKININHRYNRKSWRKNGKIQSQILL